jgi:adenosylcobinamide kinase / adenosylcobinamide-phosphate guanylyltransferase
MGKLILITGGARSGKSRFAQELAAKSGNTVLFVATAQALDDAMKKRIENHRRSRPAGWRTLEAPLDVGAAIAAGFHDETALIIDCVTLLVNNIFGKYFTSDSCDEELLEDMVNVEIDSILQAAAQTGAEFIIVTNEVGLGIVPENNMARVYRDVLGKANARLAARADEVYLMVAGIPVAVKRGN